MQIWNGSDEYCWRYREDTILSTDGQTDRQMDKVKPIYNFDEAEGIITYMTLTHCGLVMSYGDKYLHQHWFRTSSNCLMPDSTKPLTGPILTYHQCWGCCGFHLGMISLEMLKISILDMSFKITNQRLRSHLPGANALTIPASWPCRCTYNIGLGCVA